MSLSGYRVAGEGMPVVMLHSSLSSCGQWQELVMRLKAQFKCINIDLLGYGDAPEVTNPESFALEDESKRILSIIDSEAGSQDFMFVGHSYGGAVGLHMANLVGKRIKAMALYEPVAFHLLERRSQAFQNIEQISGSLAGLEPSDAARTFVDYWNGDGFFARMPAKVRAMFSDKIGKVQLDFQGLMGQSYCLSDLELDHCPVLVLAGQHSPLSSRTIAAKLRDELPNVQYREFDGGHMAPIAQATDIAEIFEGYLCKMKIG